MDLFECPVCMTDMVDRTPRCLLCLHSFCTECLTKLNEDSAIQCPTCREITKLKTNNVNELKFDFRLLQMKEREQNKTPAKSSSSQNSHCHICHVTEPLFKCKECSQLLCNQCKTKHDNIDAYRCHQVAELCVKHQDGITHLCKSCIIPLCTKCILLDHADHQEQFLKFDEGKKNLLKQAGTMHNDIRKSIQNMNQMHDNNQETRTKFVLVKHKLRQHKENLSKRLEEVNKCIKETEVKEEEFNKLCAHKAELEAEGDLAAISLTSLRTDTTGFCQEYTKIEAKAKQTLDKIKQVSLDYEPLPYQVAEPCDCKIVMQKPGSVPSLRCQPEPIRKLVPDRVMFNIGPSADISPGLNMCLGEHGALVVNNVKKPNVIEVSETGKVMNKYYPMKGGNIRAVARLEDKIFIAQSKSISVVPKDTEEKVDLLDPKVNDIKQILLTNKTTIYISNKTSIYSYNMMLDQTTLLVEGLNTPSYMAVLHTDRGIQYVMTEWQSHTVLVFDEAWKLRHKFGKQGNRDGQFQFPKGIAVTDMNTLIIADGNNNRISHYTLEGKLLSHLLTDEDGMELPRGVIYRKPYLWVCSDYPQYIQCFRLN